MMECTKSTPKQQQLKWLLLPHKKWAKRHFKWTANVAARGLEQYKPSREQDKPEALRKGKLELERFEAQGQMRDVLDGHEELLGLVQMLHVRVGLQSTDQQSKRRSIQG
jgi:hypothetical protein